MTSNPSGQSQRIVDLPESSAAKTKSPGPPRGFLSRLKLACCPDCLVSRKESDGDRLYTDSEPFDPDSITVDDSGEEISGDIMVSFEEIREKCLRNGTLYEDPTFPANASILYRDGPVTQVVWKRPKDLTRRPFFFHDEAAYFDMDQGVLGDCWFVASAVCLAASPHRQLLFRVVPKDQGFDSDYCGAFRFYFWQYGKWREVVVDDRLPTVNGRLVYGWNREEPNEFWCPLLEKAYAKLYGSFHAIHGGFMDEGLVDLTGGIGEAISLGLKDTRTLKKIIINAHNMNSVLGGTINFKNPRPGMREVQIDNGLYQGHAYSIINVKEMEIDGKEVTLLHLRNPWGRGEWKGPWSDRSKEWRSLSEKDRKATFKNRDDGEFWISLEDFIQNFDFLCMAHLTPDAHSREVADNLHLTQWNMAEHTGTWVRGVSAGGPLKSFMSASFWTNPQFKLSLSKASEATAVIISLFEINTPAVRTLGEVRIGFTVFQMNKGKQPSRINEENYYEFTPRLVATSQGFTIHREVTKRFMMEPLDHIIVPCTQKAGQQTDFYLRIFSDKKIDAKPFDAGALETSTTDVKPPNVEVEDPKTNLSPAVDKEFNRLAGDWNAIDANDLVSLLKSTGNKVDSNLNVETCRCLFSVATIKSKKGLATKKELEDVLEVLNEIKRVFVLVDNNSNKSVDKDELETLLNILEHYPNEKVIDTVWRKYCGKSDRLSLEDFIQTACKFIVLSRSYDELDYLAKSYIQWQEWAQAGFI